MKQDFRQEGKCLQPLAADVFTLSHERKLFDSLRPNA